MSVINLITVAEFKEKAPEVDTSRYTGPTVSGFITQSSEEVGKFLQFDPIAENISNELKNARVTTDGDLLIFPAKIPIISVSALSVKKGTTELTITLQDSQGNDKFNLDYTKRNLRFPAGEIILQGQTVLLTDFFSLRATQFYSKMSYRAGYEVSSLPESIKQATVLYTREELARSKNTTGARRISQGGLSIEYEQRSKRFGGRSDLIVDAEKLLRPYRRIG